MTRFEYLVVYQENQRVLTANGNWQGTVERGEDGDVESCPTEVAYLADAGAQGWELVAIDPEETGTGILYFKRTHLG